MRSWIKTVDSVVRKLYFEIFTSTIDRKGDLPMLHLKYDYLLIQMLSPKRGNYAFLKEASTFKEFLQPIDEDE